MLSSPEQPEQAFNDLCDYLQELGFSTMTEVDPTNLLDREHILVPQGLVPPIAQDTK